MATPERNGACKVPTSAEVTADQRTASRNAASCSGGSKPLVVTVGSDPLGSTCLPGSTSQMTSSVSPKRPSSTLCKVTSVLESAGSTSLTTHFWPRTETSAPVVSSASVELLLDIPAPH